MGSWKTKAKAKAKTAFKPRPMLLFSGLDLTAAAHNYADTRIWALEPHNLPANLTPAGHDIFP